MESEMIERVAKALHRAHYERGRRLYPASAWDLMDRFERETWLFSARAAIEAMRKPTPAIEAEVFAALEPGYCETEVEMMRDRGELGAIWSGLINAALTPQDKGSL